MHKYSKLTLNALRKNNNSLASGLNLWLADGYSLKTSEKEIFPFNFFNRFL